MKHPMVLIIIILSSLLHGCVQSGNIKDEMGTQLKFNQTGRFKIAQFTVIHRNPSSAYNQKNLNVISNILSEEKPDLVIYTGDIVANGPARKGWIDVTKPLTGAGIPWTVTLGNHDDEADMTRDQIYDLLQTLPGFAGIKGSSGVSGTGNYVIPVVSATSEKTAALI